MDLLKYAKKSIKPLDIADAEIKKNSECRDFLKAYTWYSIGDSIFSESDEIKVEYEILAAYNTTKYAIVQYLGDDPNCVWQADSIEDLNSVLYNQACLSYFVSC